MEGSQTELGAPARGKGLTSLATAGTTSGANPARGNSNMDLIDPAQHRPESYPSQDQSRFSTTLSEFTGRQAQIPLQTDALSNIMRRNVGVELDANPAEV